MPLTKKRFLCATTQALTIFTLSTNVMSDTIESKSLSFGSIAVISNNTREFIRINHNGIVSSSSSVMIVSPPSTGEFILTNFPPNQRLFISGQSLLPSSISTRYSPEQFSLTNIDVPSVIFSDVNGSAILPVGGTLSTSGSGNNTYIDTDYTIQYQITVNY